MGPFGKITEMQAGEEFSCSTSLFGSYSQVKYDGGANDNLLGAGTTTAKGTYCAAFAASHQIGRAHV